MAPCVDIDQIMFIYMHTVAQLHINLYSNLVDRDAWMNTVLKVGLIVTWGNIVPILFSENCSQLLMLK